MKTFAFLVLLGGWGLASAVDYELEFSNFMKTHDKSYDTQEFFLRYHIFQDNLDMVNKHNAGESSYTLGINKYSDLTSAEFAALANGYIAPSKVYGSAGVHEVPEDFQATAIDWRSKGAVTKVKDQGQCGSCWAFSTTGAVEGAFQIATGKLDSFAEQQLVDCAGSTGNHGCQGGLMDYAFRYIESSGICLESAYPYTARNGRCQTSCSAAGHITGFKDVRGESGLASALAVGPVSIAIEADQSSFQHYRSGVFTGPCGTRLDHGVLLVGSGTDGGQDYWIVKNSWGSSWGDQGYIRFVQGKNLCGLGNAPSYPTGAH